jgi:prepilin-type N-terminal cleavage/methylation domain-containing protein
MIRLMIRRARRNEDGVTLIELAIVLMLMSIVATMLVGFLGSVFRVSTRATNDSETQKAITLALRPVTENIRGTATVATTYPATTSCTAGSYPTGYSNCLSVTVLRPVAGQLSCRSSVFTYGLKSDGILREDRTDYALVGGTCVVTTSYTGRPILTNIMNGAQPLFTYFDRFGNKLDPAASGQTTAPFITAVTIRVTLNVQFQSGSPLLSYTSDLALRNNR